MFSINWLLDRAIKNLEVEYVAFGIQEQFRESVVHIAKKLDLKYSISEDRPMASFSRPKMGNVSTETIEKIKEFNQADLILYKHAKELFASRIRQSTP